MVGGTFELVLWTVFRVRTLRTWGEKKGQQDKNKTKKQTTHTCCGNVIKGIWWFSKKRDK